MAQWIMSKIKICFSRRDAVLQSSFVVSIEDHLQPLKMAIDCAHAFHIRINEAKCHGSDICVLIDPYGLYRCFSEFDCFFPIVDKSHIIYLHEVHSQDVSLTRRFHGWETVLRCSV